MKQNKRDELYTSQKMSIAIAMVKYESTTDLFVVARISNLLVASCREAHVRRFKSFGCIWSPF